MQSSPSRGGNEKGLQKKDTSTRVLSILFRSRRFALRERRVVPCIRVSQFFPERHKHVVLQPPRGSGVSWKLRSNQGPTPQGGRPCTLHPASARSYSRSAPSSPRPRSPPSSISLPGGASPTATATSPS